MTEEEAKTKWCPHSRAVLYGGKISKVLSSGHNRATFSKTEGKDEDYLNPEFCRCIGSECMSWRWVYGQDTVPGGYCGLAGEP